MQHSQQHRLSVVLFVLLGFALVALAIADMLIGTEAIPVREIISSLWGDVSVEHETIIYKLRMPKVIVAILSGMALSASGLLMQTLFRSVFSLLHSPTLTSIHDYWKNHSLD